jgi:hypothetical protein
VETSCKLYKYFFQVRSQRLVSTSRMSCHPTLLLVHYFTERRPDWDVGKNLFQLPSINKRLSAPDSYQSKILQRGSKGIVLIKDSLSSFLLAFFELSAG